VRIYEAGDHEEGPATLACFTRGFAQPSNALARDERIVVEAVPRGATDIPTRTEYLEAVRLGDPAVVDRRLRREDVLVHLELAEVRGPVAKSSEYRSHVGQVGTQGRDEVVLHLIEHPVDLRWLAGKECRTGRRAHGRCDVMVAERDAVTRDRFDAWERII